MTHTAKHTPGPWVAQHRSWGWDIANGSDLICSGPEHASKNAQANACIIAAAPAMYEALKAILDSENSTLGDGGSILGSDYRSLLQAVLAQAEGGGHE